MYNEQILDNAQQGMNVAQVALFRQVFVWMAFALAITGLTAMIVVDSPTLLTSILGNQGVFFGLLIGELALVWILSSCIRKMSFTVATLMFIVYSIVNGATMSVYLLVYTMESVASTFFITAGMFGTMAFIGITTKKDLTSWGSLLMMGLIGIIIASVVNIFLASTTLYWIITYVGVLLFVALTAYDVQFVKRTISMQEEINDDSKKVALLGALSIYLDFINLFIYLIRIFGKRK